MNDVRCPNCGNVLGQISKSSESDILEFLEHTKCNVCAFKQEKEVPDDEKKEKALAPLEDAMPAIFRRFRAACIAQKINSSDRVRAVYDFMSSIEIWINRLAPKEALEEIDKAFEQINADAELSGSLSPYVTNEILEQMRIELKGVLE